MRRDLMRRLAALERDRQAGQEMTAGALDALVGKLGPLITEVQATLDAGRPAPRGELSIMGVVALAVVRETGPVRTPDAVTAAALQVARTARDLDVPPGQTAADHRHYLDALVDQLGIEDLVTPRV